MNKLYIYIIALALAACMCSCRSKTVPVMHHTDSVRTEIREVTVYVRDTVQATLPAQSVQSVSEDRSHLETDYAESDAWINTDGSIGHRLANKTTSVSVPVDVPHTTKDSVRFEYVERETPVYVEKSLTALQNFKLRFFWLLVLISVILIYVSFKLLKCK